MASLGGRGGVGGSLAWLECRRAQGWGSGGETGPCVPPKGPEPGPVGGEELSGRVISRGPRGSKDGALSLDRRWWAVGVQGVPVGEGLADPVQCH